MRKWATKYDYLRLPHANECHESLWWYDESDFGVPTDDTLRVVDAYFAGVARGRKVKPNERDALLGYLVDLAYPHQVTVRRKKYWTLDAYALKHQLPRQWFFKMFRRLEEVASALFPNRVPPHRRDGVRNAELRSKRAAAAERHRLQEEWESQQPVSETPAPDLEIEPVF
jgi:hypothetical protein